MLYCTQPSTESNTGVTRSGAEKKLGEAPTARGGSSFLLNKKLGDRDHVGRVHPSVDVQHEGAGRVHDQNYRDMKSKLQFCVNIEREQVLVEPSIEGGSRSSVCGPVDRKKN